MNQGNRFCIVQGHQKYQTYQICTFKQCQLSSRWCCSTCLQKQIHNHQMIDQSHILDQKELQDKLTQDLQKLQDENQLLQKYNKQTLGEIQSAILELNQHIQQFQQQVMQQLSSDMQEKESLLQYIIQQFEEENYALIQNEQINKIFELELELEENNKFDDQGAIKQLLLMKEPIIKLEEIMHKYSNSIKMRTFCDKIQNIETIKENTQNVEIFSDKQNLETYFNQQQENEIFQNNLLNSQKIFEEIQVIKYDKDLNQLLKAHYNIFIIGLQKSGKSTLANVLSDQQNLYFQNEGYQYSGINEHYFDIAQAYGMGTSQSDSIIIQDYQIWDFPGYDLEWDLKEDDEIRIKQITMMNKASAIHIIIVFPYTQVKNIGYEIIQLMNLIAQKDLPASIIISKVPQKQKLQDIVEKLQTQLGQDKFVYSAEANKFIYSAEAKDFLDQLIKNKRIQLLYQPQQVEDNYQFKQEGIEQIKELVFDKKNFNKVKIEYRFLPSQQLIINDYIESLMNKSNKIDNQVIKQTVQNNIKQVQYENKNDRIFKYIQINYQFMQDTGIMDQQIMKINEFFTNKDVKIIQNQLYITVAGFSLSELKSIYDSNRNIQEIFIQSHYYFVVDCDIEMPGVHLYIKCQQFIVQEQSLINLKGQPGQPISKQARSGDEKNIHGDVGQDGNQGQAGGIFYVDAQEYFCIEILIIDISGGDGGNGQDGGDGLNGNDGENGKAEEVEQRLKECEVEVKEQVVPEERVVLLDYIYVSLGTPGGIGGDSGCCGLGGQPGAKGTVNFKNNLKYCNILDCNSIIGKNGKNGKPGRGGQKGLDFIGLYQESEHILQEVDKYQLNNRGAKKITSYIYFPLQVGLINSKADTLTQLMKDRMKSGWKYRNFNENKMYGPSGTIMNSLKQQQKVLKEIPEVDL